MTRWGDETEGRGATYDDAWEQRAAKGEQVHGEADLVRALLTERGVDVEGSRILDAGCGTGRVAIELARHGAVVVGADLDESMLARAREKAPDLDWHQADLSTMDLDEQFDLVVMAGNIMIFVAPGTERSVLERTAAHVTPGGLFITGFSLQEGRYQASDLDRDATAAGLSLVSRWSTWDRDEFTEGDDYAVSLYERIE